MEEKFLLRKRVREEEMERFICSEKLKESKEKILF